MKSATEITSEFDRKRERRVVGVTDTFERPPKLEGWTCFFVSVNYSRKPFIKKYIYKKEEAR